MSVIVADKREQTDGSAHSFLNKINSELPILLISRPDGFVFNDEVLKLRDYIIADFCEYGWDENLKYGTHLFGYNTELYSDKFRGDEWHKLEFFIKENPPKIYFKRELLGVEKSGHLLPIEYPCLYNIPEIQTREQFNSRPLQTFFSWGFSSEHRRQLHGRIWTDAPKHDYMVCDNLYYLNGFLQHEGNPKKWLTINTPHYCRHPMEEVLNINGLAKVSVSMPGAGGKCFRHSESPINSVMAMQKTSYAWSFPWDETNSIQFELGNEVEAIAEALRDENLYDRYVKGVENCRNYFLPNYIAHIEKIIRDRA